MKRQSTYQRYREENIRLKQILSMDMQRFLLHCNLEEFKNKSIFLNKCILEYRRMENENI